MTMRRHILIPIFLSILSIGLYARTIGYEFVWDDSAAIVTDARAHGVGASLRAFYEPVDRLYRPIRTVSFAIDATASTKQKPALPFHLTNIVLYAAIVVAFYLFLMLLMDNILFAAVAAALFAAMPVHAETVAWISGGRADLLACPALFASLGALLRFVRKESSHENYLLLGIVAWLFALLSKESAATGFLVFFAGVAILPHEDFKSRNRRIVKAALFLLASTGVYAVMRVLGAPSTGQAMASHGDTIVARIATISPVFLDYFRLVALPLKQCAIYTRDVATPPYMITILPAATALGVLLIFGVAFYKRKPYVSFWIAWWLLTLLPVMNILPLAMLQAERFVFLPSAAFCAFAAGAFCVNRPAGLSAALKIAVSIFFLLNIALTWNRTPAWKSDGALWTQTAQCAPFSFIAHFNFGNECVRTENLRGATAAYKRAAVLKPDFYPANERLGDVYGVMGRYDLAVAPLKDAMRYNPSDSQLDFKLGYAYEKLGNRTQALRWYNQAYVMAPSNELLDRIYRLRAEEGLE